MDDMIDHLTSLAAAMTAGDVPVVERIAHQLKGSALATGALRLADTCAAIEQAAVRQDAGSASSKVDELARYLERVQLE